MEAGRRQFERGERDFTALALIEELAAISSGPNGRMAIAYTEGEDRVFERLHEMGESLVELAREQNMELSINEDAWGNLYFELRGRAKDSILICSHGDSVYSGGDFDGLLGVSMGLQIIERLIEEGSIPEKSLVLMACRGEESSATGRGLCGSGIATGKISANDLRGVYHAEHIDENGKRKNLYDILKGRYIRKFGTEEGFDEAFEENPERFKNVVFAHEIHIDQSHALADHGKAVLPAIAIGGSRRFGLTFSADESIFEEVEIEEGKVPKLFVVKIQGRADHSGAAPMNGEVVGKKVYKRQDALVEMANLFEKIAADGGEFLASRLVNLSVPNASYNTVPGVCEAKILVYDQSEADFLSKLFVSNVSDDIAVSCSFEGVNGKAINVMRSGIARGAMRIISDFGEIGARHARETEGMVRVTVGGANINRQGHFELLIDRRSLDDEGAAPLLDEELNSVIESVKAQVSKAGIILNGSQPKNSPSIKTHKYSYADAKRRTRSEGIKVGSMPSHDLVHLLSVNGRNSGQRGPAPGMLWLVRSNGISHNPREFADSADIEEAFRVVYPVVLEQLGL